MLRRIPFVVLALTVLLLSIALFPSIQAYALTATLPPPTITITRSPTASCVAPTYTMSVTPSASTVQVGGQITVSAYTSMGIPNYTLTIIDNATGTTQSATNPIFTPISNATMSGPAAWTLTAVRAGSVSFFVSATGEIQSCSGGNLAWVFSGKSATSGNVTVTQVPTPGALPDLTVLSITEYTYISTVATSTAQFVGCQPNNGSASRTGLRVTVQNLGNAAAGAFVVDLNGTQQSVTGLAAGQSLAVDFASFGVNVPRTRNATVDVTGLVAESNELNNTYSLILSAATGTATVTPYPCIPPTLTPATNTPTPTFTLTPSKTPTTQVGVCSPVSATIAAPFTKDGAGTFCWQSSNLGSYVNSWNLATLSINGINFTNVWTPSSSYPAKINGYWYVGYAGSYSWSHFEAK